MELRVNKAFWSAHRRSSVNRFNERKQEITHTTAELIRGLVNETGAHGEYLRKQRGLLFTEPSIRPMGRDAAARGRKGDRRQDQ